MLIMKMKEDIWAVIKKGECFGLVSCFKFVFELIMVIQMIILTKKPMAIESIKIIIFNVCIRICILVIPAIHS